MIGYILLTVLAAAIAYGVGWWHANRRARTRLATVRANLARESDAANHGWNVALGEVDGLRAQLTAMRVDRDAYRDAHHRGAQAYEDLLNLYRAVPEAFRAPLDRLDERREHITPVEMLFDAYDVPRPDVDAAEAVRLAAIIDEPTDVWKRVIYRPVPKTDTTVHEGVLLDRAGVALVPARTYPAPKQRHGKGKRR